MQHPWILSLQDSLKRKGTDDGIEVSPTPVSKQTNAVFKVVSFFLVEVFEVFNKMQVAATILNDVRGCVCLELKIYLFS